MIDRSTCANTIRPFRAGARRTARGWACGIALGVFLLSSAGPVGAEEYHPSDAGNPLRIAGYIVYPVGVVFDYLLLRPMYWVGSHEPFRTLFGRDE